GVRTFTLVITQFVSLTGSVTGSLADGSLGVPYSQNLLPFDSAGTVTWNVAFGSALPPGLNLSPAGVVSGIPTVAGKYFFTLTASDASGTAAYSFSLWISTIVVADPVSLPAGGILPIATVGTPYNYPFTGTGGAGTLVWSATGLPNGL